MEICSLCRKEVSLVIATKETKNKVSDWRCEECWLKNLKTKRKKALQIKTEGEIT